MQSLMLPLKDPSFEGLKKKKPVGTVEEINGLQLVTEKSVVKLEKFCFGLL